MEDTLDGTIVKTGDDSFAEQITVIFDNMVNDADSAVELVNNSYQLYEDEGVKVDELQRAENKLVEERGVSQQMRASMESYVSDDDVVLPAAYMYTSEPSMVNFDTTLAWVRAKCDETRLEQIRVGARFASMSFYWIKQYGLEPSDDGDLENILNKIESAEERCSEYYLDATADLETSKVPLFEFITSLGIDPNTIDTDIHENWSASSRKRKVLEQLINPTIGITLNALTIALGHESRFKDEFEDYQSKVSKIFKAVLKAQKEVADGKSTQVDLSSIDGNIVALNKETTEYTLLLSQVGYGHALTMDFVDAILKQGHKTVELLDDDYAEELMSTRNQFVDNYNLDNVADKTGIEIDTPEALLQAMDENNTVVTALLDALRLIAATYNSLLVTASIKNNLVSRYGMLLSSLVE